MNERKIQRLLEAARQDATPEPSFDFSRSVVAAIRRLPERVEISFADQLGRLFPRIAFATLLIIGLCAGFDVYFTDNSDSLVATVEQAAADEWLIAGK